jgi:hypothetical protein
LTSSYSSATQSMYQTLPSESDANPVR